MILEETIMITSIEGLDSSTHEWKEISKRIKNRIQPYKGKLITMAFLDALLDSEGEINEAWSGTTYDHPYDYISYRSLPITEARKAILKERDREKGIKGYVVNGQSIPIETFDDYTNSNLVLYLRKVYNQNKCRIGIFDINWVSAGMGIRPQTRQIEDLIDVSWKSV